MSVRLWIFSRKVRCLTKNQNTPKKISLFCGYTQRMTVSQKGAKPDLQSEISRLDYDHIHGLRTPNEGINQRNLKIWADVADKTCFGRT